MYVLGINAAFHHSAAALFYHQHLLAAAEEERFTRINQAKTVSPYTSHELPFHAIDYCLQSANITLAEINQIAYSFDPHQLQPTGTVQELAIPVYGHLDPLFTAGIEKAPEFLQSHYQDQLNSKTDQSVDLRSRWHFIPHQLAHAASAYYCSGFKNAAILVMDMRGEKAACSQYQGENGQLRLLNEVFYPHSFGLLLKQLMVHLGFPASIDDYNIMALNHRGKPIYLEELHKYVKLDNGSYSIAKLNMEALFGQPRQPEEPLSTFHFDLIASFQALLEQSVLHISNGLKKTSGCSKICLAGNLFNNNQLNAHLFTEGGWDDLFVQPASGDEGTAIGSAQVVLARQAACRLTSARQIEHVNWGPEYSDDHIFRVLQTIDAPRKKMSDNAPEIAELLRAHKLVGWFQGKLEFGSNSSGSRSIFASPILEKAANDPLKYWKAAEDYSPDGIVIMEEAFSAWFEGAFPSPYFVYLQSVKEKKKSRLPQLFSLDKSFQVQTICADQNPLLYHLLATFHQLTGIPFLLHSSFKNQQDPLICTPEEAIDCFANSPLDALAIGSYLVTKKI